MKSLLILPLLTTVPALNTSLCSSPPLSIQAANTFVLRDYAPALLNGQPYITYEHGVAWRALEMVYNTTQNSSYLDHIISSVDNIVTPNGTLLDYNLTYYTLDDIRIGETLIFLNEYTSSTKYKTSADLLRSQLQSQPRNPSGGYWHRSTYPNQMWLDGLYMEAPFYAHHTSFYHPSNTTAFNDIVNQFNLTFTNCFNFKGNETGLLKHAYDSSKEAVWADNSTRTGQSPESWGRALGWWVMALVDVLDYFTPSHPGYGVLISYLNVVLEGVKKDIDPASGLWWDVMTQPGRELNYIESSGGAMFVYAMLKGVRKGYLEFETFHGTATSAYGKMVGRFLERNVTDGGLDWEGTVSVGDPGSFSEYVVVPLAENDLKGFAPFVMASVEYERAVC